MNLNATFVVAVLVSSGCQWTYTSSAQVEPEKVRPFLSQLEAELGLGLNVESLSTFVEIVPANEMVQRKIDIQSDGAYRTVRFVVAMDQAESPTLMFKTYSRELFKKIDTHINTSPYVGHEAT